MSKRFARLAAQGALLGMVIGAAACTEVNNVEGNSLIPQNQQLSIAQMEVTGSTLIKLK